MNILPTPSRRSFRFAMVLLSGTALAGMPLLSSAQAQTWTGTTSTDWFTATNWDTNTVPTALSAGVTIATLTPNATVINGGNAFSAGLYVGEVTPGSLTISNGGTLNNTGVTAIGSGGGVGTMLVTGAGSSFITSSTLYVAYENDGTLSIANQASVSAGSLIMSGLGGTSQVNVDGAGSLLSVSSLTMVAGPIFSPANATLAITSGAHVMDSDTADLGYDVGQATITVDGTGSLFHATNTIEVGSYGNGVVSITNGGVVSGGADINIGGAFSNAANAVGSVIVDGAGSQMDAVGYINVGYYGNGSLTVRNAAQIDSFVLTAGYYTGSSGTITITGAGSNAIVTEADAGVDGGSGTLSILNGATLSAQEYNIGFNGSTGVSNVDGNGSLVANSDSLTVGGFGGGSGTLTISNGGIVNNAGPAEIGYSAPNSGTVTVTDENSALNVTGNLNIGDGGTGILNLKNGGTFSGSTVDIGVQAGSQGTLSVITFGSAATVTNLTVGDAGTGLVSLDNLGALTDTTAVVGAQSGSTGTVLVANGDSGSGEHTVFHTMQDLIVGRDSGATGSVTISNFGYVFSEGTIELGEHAGATGTIKVTDFGSMLASGGNLSIGESGAGTINIQAGSAVYGEATTFIGHQQGATGILSVDGAGSIFYAFGNLEIGGDDANLTGGKGWVFVTNGGTISASQYILIGGSTGSTGTVTVTGAGSNITGSSLIEIGENGTGTLSVLNGATVTDLVGYVGGGGSGTVNVDGAGSSLTLSSLFAVGDTGYGTLTVSNGGAVSSGVFYVGGGTGITGIATVTGAGSTMTGSGAVYVGYQGTGDLILQDGGEFSAAAGVTIAAQAGSQGEIEIGADSNDPAAAPGILNVPTITFGAGTGYLVFNHTSTNYTFAPAISGQGEIDIAAGVTDLTADSSAFTGTVDLYSGTLLVDGKLGGAGISVKSAGTLGGKGTVTNVTVADGGTLLGVEGQTLTMTSLSLSNASNVNVTLGAPGGAGLFVVTQDVILNGVLNITAAPSFGAGVYRLIDYGTVLIDNGLDIGTTPSGTTASDFAVQTSVLGQVNLVDSHASILNFWDGAGAGNANDGAIEGGDGVWSVTAPNWTDLNGQYNGAMAPQPGFAVFEGAAGTVTVDDSAGAVGVTGMQFVTSGYTVTGDGITLGSGEVDIRVGDGTAAGASYSATIASVLTGDGTLTKTDLGTLILTGENTYTGGTNIAAGVLQIGNGGTTGSITGDINDNGTLIFDRSDVVSITNHIYSNDGIVIQAGTGTTILPNVETYSGQTIVAAGTLQGTALSFGSSSILDNATLVINQATDIDFANVISGTGTFIKQGAGSLNLIGANTLTGATTVAAGRLAVNGSLSSVVTVQTGATLGGNGTVGGVIAQSGAVVAPGNSIGTLTVAGNYAQSSGSTYQVELTSTGQADRINASGSATIANGAILNVTKTDAAAYVPGTQYTVLTAGGGVSGAFTLTGDTAINLFTGLVAKYDAHDVYLVIGKIKSFASAGATLNQVAAGGGADDLALTDPLAAALAASPSIAAAQGAFDQISGEIHASAKTATLEDSRFPREAALNRLSTAFAQGNTAPWQPSLWGQVYGSWGSTDSNGNAAALNRSSRGLLGGVDMAVADVWRLGIMAGYSRGDFNVKDRSSAGSSDNYHLGVYVGTQQGALGVRFGAAYSWNDLSVGRTVAFAGFNDALGANYTADTTQAFVEVGYHIQAEKVDIEPFANLAYVNLHTDNFVETGGAAALNGIGNTEGVTFTTLGLRGTYDVSLGDRLVGTHATVGWRHAFGDLTPSTTVNFAGSGAFTIQGAPLAQDGAAYGVGFDLAVAESVLLDLSYDGQYASKGNDNTIKLNLDWKL